MVSSLRMRHGAGVRQLFFVLSLAVSAPIKLPVVGPGRARSALSTFFAARHDSSTECGKQPPDASYIP